MKTILLLAFAVFVSGAHLKNDKNLLGELMNELNAALKTLPKETKVRFNICIVTIISQICDYNINFTCYF